MNSRYIKPPVVGIVAEYNPFHNGHRLHMETVKASLPGAVCIVVLSSSFTQRGIPGIVDKWARARMALLNGADLVFELPFLFACNAAPEFGGGATDILARSGLATHIAFGMEDNGYDISTILDILIQEPASFKQRLQQGLAHGRSYPKAAAEALESLHPGSAAFLSSPNNALALSYLLHIHRRGYPLAPVPIRRSGGGYHELTPGPLSSATAIRSALRESWDTPWTKEAMPPATRAILDEAKTMGRLRLDSEPLWPLLRFLLLRTSPEDLRRFAGMDEGMENLFLRHYTVAASYEDFIGRCVCARYTRSRIQRQTIRLLAGVDRWSALAVSRAGVPYIRLLGCTPKGRELLRERGKHSSIPIITRLAAAKGPVGKLVADAEFRASKLYELLIPEPDMRREERQRPCFE